MKTAQSMMHVETPTASHLPILTAALESAEPGSIVIEHGAGLYSTPLLCRYQHRIICAESHHGWSEWATWMYRSAGRDFEIVETWKRLVPHLKSAAVVFIDGNAGERGRLLAAALDAGASLIIQHDTQQDTWPAYRIYGHMFQASGYDVSHDSEPQRTTTWRRRS